MEYTFNPEKIIQLAYGNAVLEHTKKKGDLDLLRQILKAANYTELDETEGLYKFYCSHQYSVKIWNCYDVIPDYMCGKPVYGLHDFVSPTKEELATIESIDARLKELERLRDETPELIIEWVLAKRKAKEEQPKAEWTPKVGEWVYVESFDTYILVESVDEQRVHGYNQSRKDAFHVLINGLRAATEEEIGNYLIGLAKAKGFVQGAKVKKANFSFNINGELWYNTAENYLADGYNSIWNPKQGWAEVLPEAKEEFDVAIREERFGDHYYIQVSNRATGFTKEQAEKYAETIKNALNG